MELSKQPMKTRTCGCSVATLGPRTIGAEEQRSGVVGSIIDAAERNESARGDRQDGSGLPDVHHIGLVVADRDRALATLHQGLGPEALSYDALAGVIGRAIGRSITHKRLTVDQLGKRFEDSGMPPAYAAALASMDGAIQAGEGDYVTTAVPDITGAPATSFARFADDNRAAWQRA